MRRRRNIVPQEELRSDTTSELAARLFVAKSMNATAFETMIDVRNEVGRRLAAIADDWTIDRTLSREEAAIISLAAQQLGAKTVQSIATGSES